MMSARHRAIVGFVATALLMIISVQVTVAIGQDPVTIMLSSGRSFNAWMDERTDAATLWLRFQTPRTVVLRPVAWDRVAAGRYQGRSLSVEQLRELAASITTKAADVNAEKTGPESIDAPNVARDENQSAALAPPVRALTVRAELGNWDADQEPDGLVLWVAPQDAFGRLDAVSGHVEVQLLAPVLRHFHEAPSSNGASLEQIAAWTEPITADAIGERGAQLLLPFQAFVPTLDQRVGSFGMVQVRLVVPGHGVFERTIQLVRLRTFSPLRDRFGTVD